MEGIQHHLVHNWVEDSHDVAMGVEGTWGVVVVVVGIHRVAGVGVGVGMIEVHMQWLEEEADPNETYVEQVVLLLALHQTFHLFCPFQPCVVSAYSCKPCNKPCLSNNSEPEKPLEVRHFL